ncbi:MAG: DNA-formamidopyrimidine glycosylase [Candidatus Nealsonbacteria bacterium RIFOXYB1_FULL_40_15]|uniref:DNA-formamidopyrimidine glycosylase n=2 Tax=Candidatus Nealsoniibacteriota TaxID=1817911 RepID=A0A1G2ETX6_9BACT|nr:MAG: DNA-formamidopyrimidine glycosylase [Candidatus Nealsonbacteria bacterium RIFOXYB1_FULL_40_15]OGZ29157.1 MAG: DNA-formamidopyrimidine glycosylase [Candidatus Nealsonbacteria bacterium RIFOXYC1_FULL_40_7]OGZ29709.1 MAG: DNA-formamidopyrimidine glycosylase [Candidatus Nealsonbacteria bacterium RIFOXYD1_FULL_39_11]
MPEFPEVETTRKSLESKVLNRTFVDVWTDEPKIIKKDWSSFRKEIIGKKIVRIWRKGKNLIFDLSGGLSMLTHLKLTGHYLYDRWNEKDPMNSFVHAKFILDNGKTLALSDLRKFAKIELKKKEEIEKDLEKIGPDPFQIGSEEFEAKIRKKRGKIKQVLMDQTVVSGIGNIYSDEILWESNVHPERKTADISEKEMQDIYKSSKKILKKALEAGGTSISDFRNTEGIKGKFGEIKKAYGREGQKCFRCSSLIKRKKIGQRSAHFCPSCQKL